MLSLLVFCVQLALAAPAAAQPFTGAFSPTIIGERADLNGDGVVNGADDSNNFYGDTDIIDGMLDCNAWGLGDPNDGSAGDGVILANDDCTLIGYDGTPDGVTIVVSGGEFQVADGPLPTVFNAADPDNPDIGDSDFAWSAIGGRVDSNGDETIDGDDCHFGLIGETVDAGLGDATDGADILGNPGANECGFVSPPAGANNGFVDLNSDTVITALADTCAGCFFGLDVVAGLVQAPGPDTITLEPADATNTVGDPHLVTATLEDMFGNPVAGEDVHFAVTGVGTPDPAGGDVDTDAAGEADFTFTNETAGVNTITACVDADGGLDCDLGELSDTATKTWEPGEPFAIALEPATDTNPVGSDHTVTATVEDEFGNLLAGEDVHFAVTGAGTPVPASGDDATDVDGEATFTFTNAAAGVNTITACVDADGGSDCDMGELSDTATKTWQVRVPTAITLEPSTDTNTVGSDHTVTATVIDQFDDPVAGEDVHFAVTGAGTPVPASGDDATDVDGEATFTFTNETAGVNTITACVDADGGSDCDMGELSDTATKTWEPGDPFAIALEPATDSNVVGTDHTVTATVEDEFGNLLAGEDVHFAVTGVGTPVPASGDDATDVDGEATFTFTNETAGTNTITACVDADGGLDCDGGELTDTATKTWVPGPAVAISLEPATDTNPAGAPHTVTATVTDGFGNPVAGEDVHFDVTGAGTPDPAAGHDVTDVDGEATFTFTNDFEGTNTITACIDADDGVDCDPGEASDTATKTWTVTPTCPGFEADPRNQVVGTSGPDVLEGTPGPDIICGLEGNDVLRGLGGNDLLLGGAGADEAIGGGGADTARGAGGADELNGGGGNDDLFGEGGNDVIFGGGGADFAQGGAGADTVRGGDGGDELRGGDGSDDLFGEGGKDSLFGQNGNDFLNGGPGKDECKGGAGNDTLRNC